MRLVAHAEEQLGAAMDGVLLMNTGTAPRMSKHGMLIKRQVRLRLTADMHSLEYADFDADAGGFGARKCIAVDALREVLDSGGATLGLDVAGDRVHKFDADEAYDIVTRNPGILANKPGDLENSSVGAIRGSMALVTALDGVPEQIRFAIPTLTGLTIVGLIGSRLAECAGGTCG